MASQLGSSCGFLFRWRCASTVAGRPRGNVCAMLTLQRRHSPRCPDRDKGPNHLKCRGGCLLRACGTSDDGRRMRLSLKTRDLQRAARRLTEIEDHMSGKPRKKIADAAASLRAQHARNTDATQRKDIQLIQ